MNKKKLLLIITLLILVCLLLMPLLIKHDNIGVDLNNIDIRKNEEIINISVICKLKKEKILVFYSYKCSACKKLLSFKSFKEKFIFINVDFDKKLIGNDLQLSPTKELRIFYLPYIVKLDSNYIIIKEYKLYEFLDIISNNETF